MMCRSFSTSHSLRRRTAPKSRSPDGTADMIRACLSAAVLVAALSAAHAAQAPEASPLDVEIAFLEARVSRDEADPITPTRLGHAYLRRAKAAGAFSDYRKAETSFRLALTRSAEHF